MEKDLQRYCKLFAIAEQSCKNAEIVVPEGVLVPAINELRYAGHHMMRAFAADDEQSAREEIKKAQGHAVRSIHDVYDALAIYYIDQCRQFSDEFKSIPISQAYPDYLADRQKLEDAKKKIHAIPRTSEVEIDIANKEKYVNTLQEVFNSFENARDELNKEKSKARQNARRFLMAALISSATLLLSAYGVIKSW